MGRGGFSVNILHMKYAVEVAKAGTLSKASEKLLIAQPNISRSIKELENDLGITIFERTAKGMLLTQEGEVFINYAVGIINQIEEVEKLYKENNHHRQRFAISAPHAAYIAEAFSRFAGMLAHQPVDLFYHETNNQRAIENVQKNNHNLAIIRYALEHDVLFKTMLEEKGLHYELVMQFTPLLTVSRESALTQASSITDAELLDYSEICYTDPFVPSLSHAKALREEMNTLEGRKVFVYDRASQLEILSENPDTFMWLNPLSEQKLAHYNLVQLPSDCKKQKYKDMLIHKESYALTKLDKEFTTILMQVHRQYA